MNDAEIHFIMRIHETQMLYCFVLILFERSNLVSRSYCPNGRVKVLLLTEASKFEEW